jgi:hypothetical protein
VLSCRTKDLSLTSSTRFIILCSNSLSSILYCSRCRPYPLRLNKEERRWYFIGVSSSSYWSVASRKLGEAVNCFWFVFERYPARIWDGKSAIVTAVFRGMLGKCSGNTVCPDERNPEKKRLYLEIFFEMVYSVNFNVFYIFGRFHKIAKSDYWLCRVCPSVLKEHLGSHWMDFYEIWYVSTFRKCRENSSFMEIGQEWGVLHVKTNIHFLSYFSRFFLQWEMFQIKFVEKIKIHILFSVTFFFNRSVYEKRRKNILERDMPQMTIWRLRIACRIPKATKYTHSGCVILIALPQQQWLHERASLLLRYLHFACLVLLLNQPVDTLHIQSHNFISPLVRC